MSAPSLRGRVRDFAYSHVGGTAVVLIYHRVADLETDPQLLAVSTRRFAEQIAMLSESYRIVPLQNVTETSWASGRERAVAITFDDGYADNLLSALPVLERHDAPATVFASSGYVTSGDEYWWDEIERLVLGATPLPPRFEIEIEDRVVSAELGGWASADEERLRSDAGWNVLQSPRNPRQALYAELCDRVRPLSAAQREEVLSRLHELAGVARQTRESHRPMTPDELGRLDASGVVRVGGHTVTHQVLSARSVEEQQREIAEDSAALSEMCGRRIEEFAYPYGGLADYADATVDIVRSTGFRCACSNHVGVVKPWSDAYRLPRQAVGDWEADELAEKMRRWFDEPR